LEDEASVRFLVHRVLAQLGYHVLASCSGVEAIALVERHSGPIDLLLTDVVMPGMDGCELARILLTMRPTMKVMYMSGYTTEAALRRGSTDQKIVLLEKSFTIADLLRHVRSVLGPESLPAHRTVPTGDP
jgi:two-component system, cell cycle sensor histidine kinase and response regulator CckA